MVAAVVDNRVAKAMAKQLDRVNNNPVQLRAIIADLEQEVEQLKAALQAARTAQPISGFMEVDGREVGTQAEYAKHWNIPQYTVSRWCVGSVDKKGNRSTPKLQTIVRNGKQLVFMDQPPPYGKPGRKASATTKRVKSR